MLLRNEVSPVLALTGVVGNEAAGLDETRESTTRHKDWTKRTVKVGAS